MNPLHHTHPQTWMTLDTACRFSVSRSLYTKAMLIKGKEAGRRR
ncbi:MAG: hypothetical protein ACYTGH_14935 [Planctomycetota bacterium]